VRPLSTAEAMLAATLAYVVLLISLTGARIGREGEAGGGSTVLAAAARPVALQREVAALRGLPAAAGAGVPASSCVTARTVPRSYAASPRVIEPLAFGPPVAADTAAAVNGVLIQRLCGGASRPGGPYEGPDRRLFAALDSVVNGRDPNRRLSRAEWGAGVDRFITRDARFVDARVVTRTVPARTVTYGMHAVSATDALVIRTRLARRDTGRYLVLPVRSATGRVVTLTLRLRCGFQPIL
jgi:hypothetical protein